MQDYDDAIAALPQLYSKELEKAVLATVLIMPDTADEYPIERDDFQDKRHQWIWGAFAEMRNLNESPDPAGIIDLLDRNGHLEDMGGPAYITKLYREFVTAMGFGHNVKTLKDYRARRTLMEQSQWIANKALDFDIDPGYVQDQTIDAMSRISTHNRRSRPLSEVLSEVMDDVDEAAKNPSLVWGCKTGFVDFDILTGGLQPKETVYIAGPPGVGKSLFANQLGLQASEWNPVWLVSLEMKDKSVVGRLLSGQSEVPARSIKTGMLDDQEWTKLVHTCDVMTARNVHIWDTRGMTVSQFRAEGARLKNQFGIKLIVLDYLYLLAGYEGKDEIPRTTQLSADIMAISDQLDVAIIVINSVTKEGMKGYGGALSDVRGSGQLLHNADIVGILEEAAQTATSAEIDATMRHRNLKFEKFREGDVPKGYKLKFGLTAGYPKFVSLEKSGKIKANDTDLDLGNMAPINTTEEYKQKGMERFHD